MSLKKEMACQVYLPPRWPWALIEITPVSRTVLEHCKQHVSISNDTTLVAEQGKYPKTKYGLCGKGSRCWVVWSGLGACRHGQISAERAGLCTSRIPGAREVTWDHPEPSAWIKGTPGDRGPAGGLCKACDKASFNHPPGHPTEASCRPKGLRSPATWELSYPLHLS